MGFKWVHKCDFVVKLLCTNQEKMQLMQIGSINKIMKDSYSHDSSWLGLGRSHELCYDIFCDGWCGLHQHNKNSWDFKTGVSISFENLPQFPHNDFVLSIYQKRSCNLGAITLIWTTKHIIILLFLTFLIKN
jgi:hypothetical protein